MAKVKSIAACLIVLTASAAEVGTASPQDKGAQVVAKPAEQGSEPAKEVSVPSFALRDDYVVEPPDLISVSLEQGLPGRPIHGPRLVRPDGTISLGWYGDVDAAGHTAPEIKEKVIKCLEKFLFDEVLGLIDVDANGEPVMDAATGAPKRIAPKDSKKVRVEVTKCNSKVFYVQGEVRSPGRFSLRGSENIVDAITTAGGPSPSANLDRVLIYRENSQGEAQCTAFELNELGRGRIPPIDYPLKAGDRVVVLRRVSDVEPAQPALSRSHPHTTRTVERAWPDVFFPAGTKEMKMHALERRMINIEQKLDRVLETVEKPAR